jgi:hypothetical protein
MSRRKRGTAIKLHTIQTCFANEPQPGVAKSRSVKAEPLSKGQGATTRQVDFRDAGSFVGWLFLRVSLVNFTHSGAPGGLQIVKSCQRSRVELSDIT